MSLFGKETPLLFLDIDGVLNGHVRWPGSDYCGIKYECMERLNFLLALTQARIVISSAWRYQMIRCDMTTKGFDNLLRSHGLVTTYDGPAVISYIGEEKDIRDRGRLIVEHVDDVKPERWACLDDLDPFEFEEGADYGPHLVQIDGYKGLQTADVWAVYDIMRKGAARG